MNVSTADGVIEVTTHWSLAGPLAFFGLGVFGITFLPGPSADDIVLRFVLRSLGLGLALVVVLWPRTHWFRLDLAARRYEVRETRAWNRVVVNHEGALTSHRASVVQASVFPQYFELWLEAEGDRVRLCRAYTVEGVSPEAQLRQVAEQINAQL